MSKINRKTYFNEKAETWDKMFQAPNLKFFLEKLVPQFGLEIGHNILDVGTGTGILIPYLARAVGPTGSVTAIDYSEKMIRIFKTKHSHLKNVTVELKNIEETSIPPESFDAVICFGVFPHLDKKEKVLRKINCILKSSGKIVIAHALSSEEVKAHHNRVSSALLMDVLPKANEMKHLLNETGFAGVHIKDEPGCYLCIAHKT